MGWFKKLFRSSQKNDRSIHTANYDKKTEILTILRSNGELNQYHGSSTVWYSYPLMKRIGSPGERNLCNIYTYIKEHGNPYPIAHLGEEVRNQTVHELKTVNPFFHLVYSRVKNFELRYADRNYKVGDTLVLKEWDPDGLSFTGKSCTRIVTYIMYGNQFGLRGEWVLMQLI